MPSTLEWLWAPTRRHQNRPRAEGDSTCKILCFENNNYVEKTGSGSKHLYVDKRSLDDQGRVNRLRISLASYTRNKGKIFEDGRIHISHYVGNYTPDTNKVFVYDNDPTAIQRIQEFRTTNSGQPPVQTPAEK
jgi:hypothetical protein